MTAAWNVIKAWLVTALVAGLLGLLGYVIGELRLASVFAFAGLLLCLSTYWMADRAIMGMLGARAAGRRGSRPPRAGRSTRRPRAS